MEEKNVMNVDNVQKRVYVIRGQQVMLDSDVADMYGYDVEKMISQMKKKKERFPEDFAFQLAESEVECLQLDFLNINSQSMPYVFTEEGVYMLAAVLHGEVVDRQIVNIVRSYHDMHYYILQNRERILESGAEFPASAMIDFVELLAGRVG